MTLSSDNDDLVFADEGAGAHTVNDPWKLLIVDDDEQIHQVTKLALDGFTLDERPIQFIDAYTGREAIGALVENPDVALVLMDVVMETEHAGLDAVDAIRNNLKNDLVRIILRTGQPGQAPEREVVMRYDINDYREKTDLTAKKLFTVVYTGFQLYSELAQSKKARTDLQRIVDASTTVFMRRFPQRLAKGALQILLSILGIDQSQTPPGFGAFLSLDLDAQRPDILVGIGRYERLTDLPLNAAGVPEAVARLASFRGGEALLRGPRFMAAQVSDPRLGRMGIYVDADRAVIPPDGHVLEVFCRNIAHALRSATLNQELDHTQRHLIITLGEAIEKRSKETGNHVRRVGEYSRLLARRYGLSEPESEILLIAAAMHDAGKIVVPDAILGKPGPLTAEERAVMQTHAAAGGEMFAGHDLPVLHASMIIAYQHHERWDGLGYPRKLKGEAIHLYGRIVALADVFDALSSHRCYKKAWPMEDVVATIRDERGRHFDPHLVDLFLEDLDTYLEIRSRFEDPEPVAPAA